MTSWSSIVEKVSKFPDETIHITPKCIEHLHGHENKMVPLMKPFIFADRNNDAKFRSYTYWSNNDTWSYHLPCQVNNHHIDNENLILLSHVKISS
jgi:hypothetical protein